MTDSHPYRQRRASYCLRHEGEGVHVVWSGHVSGDDIIDFLAHIHGQPFFDRLRYKLHDFSHCTSFSICERKIEEIAALDWASSRTNPHIRVALISDHPEIHRSQQLYNSCGIRGFELKVFPSLPQARDWLEEAAQQPARRRA
jgi:hypothetical protein